jgi:malate/lactate dehydrogenase
MRSATFRITLSQSAMTAVRRSAKIAGVSLNQWIGAAVAEKVAAAEPRVVFAGRSPIQVRAGVDLVSPVNPDWNVGEDL